MLILGLSFKGQIGKCQTQKEIISGKGNSMYKGPEGGEGEGKAHFRSARASKWLGSVDKGG